jgi:Transposase
MPPATNELDVFDLLGEVVVDGVRLVADRAGLAELEGLIAAASGRLDAGVVVVGVEAAGHHHQTLVGHLGDRDGLVVRLLNPAQVAAVRKQQGNRRRKTDWLDAAAICELLARGEGSPVQLDASPAATLRPLWSGGKDLVDARGRSSVAAGRGAGRLPVAGVLGRRQAARGCQLSRPLAGRLIARAASALASHPAATQGAKLPQIRGVATVAWW